MKIFALLFYFLSTSLFANECSELSKCVEYTSKLTGKKYFYDSKIKGELQASSNFIITETNADNLFTYILNTNGFARIPTSEKDTYKIIESKDIRYEMTPVINVDHSTPPKVQVNEDYYYMVYKFKNYQHGQLRQAANAIRPFLSRYARAIESGNILTIQEMASKLSMTYETIKNSDREFSKDEIKKIEQIEKEKNEDKKEEKKEDRKDSKKKSHEDSKKKSHDDEKTLEKK